MKKILLSAVILFSAVSLNAQIKMMIESELAELNKIKIMRENNLERTLVYTVESDQIDFVLDSSLTTEMILNNAENAFTEINYTPQYSKTIIRLLDDHNISTREMFGENGELTGKAVYKYTGRGLLESREMYFGSVKTLEEIYEYEGST
ncbi:MAG: hypothetical protein L0Y76_03865, partial [Ignavibacteria bacterium]|nr:hypothetical protein [Ignavibacteria bacterium]